MRNRVKLQSDYFTAVAQTGGNNLRPLTEKELSEKRKREAAQALARENKKKFDTNRDKYGKGQTKDGINSVLDLTGKINDGLGGAADGSKTKMASAKALTGWVGAGAKIGATAGGRIGAPFFGIGVAPAAVGLIGGVIGGWGASSLAEEIYK